MTIRFDLSVRNTVSLAVFAVAGLRAATLVDNVQLDAGAHDVAFNGAGLASGVYFYRLNAGGTVKTGKMVLVK